MRHPVSKGIGIVKSRRSSDFWSTTLEEVSLLGARRRLTWVIKAGLDTDTAN